MVLPTVPGPALDAGKIRLRSREFRCGIVWPQPPENPVQNIGSEFGADG
jgi:hypothetical protein